jgi:hypothetical protein
MGAVAKSYTYVADLENKSYWYSKFKYPEKEEVFFGTLETDKNLNTTEINTKMKELMDRFLPSSFSIIEIKECM